MRHLKKICETNAFPGPIDFHWLNELFLDVSRIFEFFFFTNFDAVTIKDETSK